MAVALRDGRFAAPQDGGRWNSRNKTCNTIFRTRQSFEHVPPQPDAPAAASHWLHQRADGRRQLYSITSSTWARIVCGACFGRASSKVKEQYRGRWFFLLDRRTSSSDHEREGPGAACGRWSADQPRDLRNTIPTDVSLHHHSVGAHQLRRLTH